MKVTVTKAWEKLANPTRIHTESVNDVSVRLVYAWGVEKSEILQKRKEVYGYLRLSFLVSCFCSNPVLCNVDWQLQIPR